MTHRAGWATYPLCWGRTTPSAQERSPEGPSHRTRGPRMHVERLPVISTSPGACGAWFLSLRMFMGLVGGGASSPMRVSTGKPIIQAHLKSLRGSSLEKYN